MVQLLTRRARKQGCEKSPHSIALNKIKCLCPHSFASCCLASLFSILIRRFHLLSLGLRFKTRNYSVSSQTIKERLQITQCPGCFWTGSSPSICWSLSWSWLVLEHVCIFWSQVFRMPTSGATSH